MPGEHGALDRTSFVPLYYQLQELLKEHIESGTWRPGDRLPSEPEFARQFGISRIVVRQALAILEDDRQIVRVRGRGTFVAPPKQESRAFGLSRLLSSGLGEMSVLVLDVGVPTVQRSIREALRATDDEEVLRVTTLRSLGQTPLALAYSFFRRAETDWLEQRLRTGRHLPDDLRPEEHGIVLDRGQVSIEASQCGQFEADRFGIPFRTPVFLVLATDHRSTSSGSVPFEVARVEFRGDVVQLRMEIGPEQEHALQVVVAPSAPVQ